MLRKNPGFALAAILTLALGIGANTAIFSLVDSWVLRPLPYRDGNRLVSVLTTTRRGTGSTAPADFLDWRGQEQVFESLCAYANRSYTLIRGGAEPERLDGAAVSADFFGMLGVTPQLGRDFAASDDQTGAAPVVLLSDALWRGRFGGETSVVGQTVLLDGEAATVIGVMPATFHLPLMGRAMLWRPLAFTAAERQGRAGRWLDIIGRLATDATPARAGAVLSSIEQRQADLYPAVDRDRGAVAHELRDEIGKHGGSQQALIVFGLVGCVLLIACANVANL